MKTKGTIIAEETRQACNKLSADERAELLEAGMKIINAGRWWEGLQVVDKPIPHIPQRHIDMVMPDDIKPMWENWIRGQTGLHCDDGDFGVYAHDWQRFVGKLERGQPLVDSSAEWD